MLHHVHENPCFGLSLGHLQSLLYLVDDELDVLVLEDYRIDRVPHFVGHSCVYQAQQLFLSVCSVEQDFIRDVYYLEQLLFL